MKLPRATHPTWTSSLKHARAAVHCVGSYRRRSRGVTVAPVWWRANKMCTRSREGGSSTQPTSLHNREIRLVREIRPVNGNVRRAVVQHATVHYELAVLFDIRYSFFLVLRSLLLRRDSNRRQIARHVPLEDSSRWNHGC